MVAAAMTAATTMATAMVIAAVASATFHCPGTVTAARHTCTGTVGIALQVSTGTVGIAFHVCGRPGFARIAPVPVGHIAELHHFRRGICTLHTAGLFLLHNDHLRLY
jgi:hypothetical protein